MYIKEPRHVIYPQFWRKHPFSERLGGQWLNPEGPCGGSSVESGFKRGTFGSRGRDLTTRPPRPPFSIACTVNLHAVFKTEKCSGCEPRSGEVVGPVQTTYF
ncbi:hypothetical protein AVEN_81951-1 [Araneus ventricosus]|uniref:Uncharacterized protein n=1 Tax=Araneus ventricosus TaxID=182803 RepID=A0A4Y2ILW2_ARAVE|nr:hypothetical protein AVEN_81951-1 [Araneus ventricosus]